MAMPCSENMFWKRPLHKHVHIRRIYKVYTGVDRRGLSLRGVRIVISSINPKCYHVRLVRKPLSRWRPRRPRLDTLVRTRSASRRRCAGIYPLRRAPPSG